MTKRKPRPVPQHPLDAAFAAMPKQDHPYTVYLPTSCLTCSVDDLWQALERHGFTVEEGPGLLKVTRAGAQDYEFFIDKCPSSSAYIDHYNPGKDDPKDLVQEIRELPYDTSTYGMLVSLCWLRPLDPQERKPSAYTYPWSILKSRGEDDVDPAVVDKIHERALKEDYDWTFKALVAENAKLRKEVLRLREVNPPNMRVTHRDSSGRKHFVEQMAENEARPAVTADMWDALFEKVPHKHLRPDIAEECGYGSGAVAQWLYDCMLVHRIYGGGLKQENPYLLCGIRTRRGWWYVGLPALRSCDVPEPIRTLLKTTEGRDKLYASLEAYAEQGRSTGFQP